MVSPSAVTDFVVCLEVSIGLPALFKSCMVVLGGFEIGSHQ